MNKVLIAFFLWTCASCTINKEMKEKSISTEEAKLISYLFEGATGNRPGANFLVSKNGKIVDQKSYGFADLEQKVRSTPETNYRVASVSKSFTAMAIMILENQGKITYETKLTEIFPDFPPCGKNITIRNLITHQSGLIDYDEFFDENGTKQMLDVDVLEGLKKIDSTYFFPGSEYQYSNSGYAVLAEIVKKVSGDSFANFMKKEIFSKLNMTTTEVFELEEPIENRAYGYSVENDSIVFNDQSVSSAIQGDGGVYTNVMDYFKWDQALYTDKLIPSEKLDEAFYDYDNNEKTDQDGYGYGWSIDYKNGFKIISHSGGTAGFETWVTRIPNINLSVILFTNRDGHDRHLMHRMNALVSIYSDYKIPMPVEIIMKKEIEQKGVEYGIQVYDKLRNDSRYEYNTTTPNFLGFEYYRIKKYETAKELFIKHIIEHPKDFGGYYGLALTNQKMNDVDKAILNFKMVIKLGAGGEERILERSKKELKNLIDKKSNSER